MLLLFFKVNQEECIACGLCALKAEQYFENNHEGLAYLIQDNNSGTHDFNQNDMIKIKVAYTACPTGAIKRKTQPFS
ncbi:ferredoxin [Atopobacter phocae]|uniref:ferredoxin n=1 Tax=Atopobacter phocae TaxID=136492 RepID=UPI001FE2374E|nr:ferredoxin [Atopobacter phocae]